MPILGAPAARFVFNARCCACTCNIWARVALVAGIRCCCEMLTCERICATG